MDLFGHSTGGYVCSQYALAHPQRVRRLVLHGAAGIGEQPVPKVYMHIYIYIYIDVCM